MSDLRIDRLSATAADWPVPDDVPRMLRHVAGERLEQALRQAPLPDGDWYVRRLDVDVELDPGRPLSALETDWADRIVTALRLSLRDGSADVVRYLRPEAAVDDLLEGLARGRYGHAWVWRQVGLLADGDPEPQSDPAGVALRVLARLPHGRVAALARLAVRAGVPATHRLLGTSGWVAAAALVAAETGVAWKPRAAPAGPGPQQTGPGTAHRGATATLAAAVTASGTLAPALRGSSLRPDPQVLQAWSLLAIAAAAPTLLRGPARLAALLDEVGRRLRPVATTGLVTAGPAGPAEPSAHRPQARGAEPNASFPPPDGTLGARVPGQGGPDLQTPDGDSPEGRNRIDPDGHRDAVASGLDARHDPSEPDPAATAGADATTSVWGGLLFLLNSAAQAGLPELLDQPPFLARPASWVLCEVGRTVAPAAHRDPVLRAFAGASARVDQPPPGKAERRALRACTRRWVAATAQRLRGDRDDPLPNEDDAALVQRMIRRHATIVQEPGWVEVGLRLDELDVDVRRAGLDVDPGWVWWLGHVVRFRYE